jgi:hypothetical protein
MEACSSSIRIVGGPRSRPNSRKMSGLGIVFVATDSPETPSHLWEAVSIFSIALALAYHMMPINQSDMALFNDRPLSMQQASPSMHPHDAHLAGLQVHSTQELLPAAIIPFSFQKQQLQVSEIAYHRQRRRRTMNRQQTTQPRVTQEIRLKKTPPSPEFRRREER